jgi:hypothetical protein
VMAESKPWVAKPESKPKVGLPQRYCRGYEPALDVKLLASEQVQAEMPPPPPPRRCSQSP